MFFTYFLMFVLVFSEISNNHKKWMKEDSHEKSPHGILVSVEELKQIKEKAAKGLEPYSTNMKLLIGFVDSLMEVAESWEPLRGEVVILGRSANDPVQLSSTGGKLVYGTALAWYFTGCDRYASFSKKLILDLTDTYGFRNAEQDTFHWGAQGILNLARGGTPYIYAADLLEGWVGWTNQDKRNYQLWLKDVMYNKVAWASRMRKNNWGVAGSFSAALISFYLSEHQNWKLEEISPKRIKLSPQEAFRQHNVCQLGRLKTSAEWKMDAKVPLWGILKNGAIPEEIRRGNDPIDGDYLPSAGSGTKYTMTHIEHLVAHAEFLHRLGDNSLYDHVSPDGSGSLLKAILFVINNPKKSHCFTPDRMNALYMAGNYYKHPAILQSIENCGPSTITGQRLALFGRLTHPVATNHEKQ